MRVGNKTKPIKKLSSHKKNNYAGNGFNDSNNMVLSSFVVFDDYFYITTTNMHVASYGEAGMAFPGSR